MHDVILLLFIISEHKLNYILQHGATENARPDI